MEATHSSHGGFGPEQVVYKLGQIEAKLEAIDKKLDEKERVQDAEIKDLKQRVSRVEEWRALQLGAAAAISLIIGFLIKAVPWLNLH